MLNEEQVRWLAKNTKRFSYREREILKLRYGLGDGFTYSLEKVGHIFNVTRERIRQIEKKAIHKLESQMEIEDGPPGRAEL